MALAAADLSAGLLAGTAGGHRDILRLSAAAAGRRWWRRRPVGPGNSGGNRNNGGGGAPQQGNQNFVPNEVITAFAPGATPQAIGLIARRYELTQLDSQSFPLIGTSLYRWRLGGGRTVANTVRALGGERIVASVQPNYVFTLQEETAKIAAGPQGDAAQYVLAKLQSAQAQQVATGKDVLVAVIDSEIDAKHPDLAGTIVKSFDALGGDEKPHAHGTSIAGAIAAHGKLLGIAPGAQVLAMHAFDDTPGAAHGSSFAIYKGLQWAADNGARIVNMSFAGPADPTLQRMLAAAYDKGIVLIAAAGNAGPKSDPLYPAADPNVIAVTATDSDDHLFPMANRGRYIAVVRAGGRYFRARAGRRICVHHRNLDCRRPCQRHRGAVARAQTVAQAGRYSRGLDGHRPAARAAAPGFGFWRRPGERLSRRDVARPQPGGAGRRRRASEAVIAVIVERVLNHRSALRTNVRSVHLLEHRHERSGTRPE